MTSIARRLGGGLNLQTFAAFELRDFRLLWANNFSYALVHGIERFAFVWLVIETLQARDFYLGLVSFTLGIPVFFFSLPAGVLADRWNRRALLFISQAIVLVAALLTAVFIWMDLMTLRMALVMSLAVGTGVAVGQPIRQALIPARGAAEPADERNHLEQHRADRVADGGAGAGRSGPRALGYRGELCGAGGRDGCWRHLHHSAAHSRARTLPGPGGGSPTIGAPRGAG